MKRTTQARLKELFNYDPETGVFTRLKQPRTWTATGRKYGKVGAGRIGTLGYVMVSVDAVNFNAGILAWLYVKGEWPRGSLKYLNGVKTDNRISNIYVQDQSGTEIKNRELTQGRLKELLHYEPGTGCFTWRLPSSVSKVGDRAGGSHGLGYRSIGVDYNKYLEHTLAWVYMTGEWPENEVDHINGEKSDNRWENLRAATRSENGHNKPAGRKSRTGFPGVYPHGGLYRARIHIEKETIDLGGHKTIAEARVARLLSEIENFGRCTTFIEDRDSNLPAIDGRTVHIELVISDVRGERVDTLSVRNHHGVPFWVKGVETITGIIASMSGDPEIIPVIECRDTSLDGNANGALGFSS